MAPHDPQYLIRRGYQDLRLLGGVFLIAVVALFFRTNHFHFYRFLLMGAPVAYTAYRLGCFFTHRCRGEAPYRLYFIGVLGLAVILALLDVISSFGLLAFLLAEIVFAVRQVSQAAPPGPKDPRE